MLLCSCRRQRQAQATKPKGVQTMSYTMKQAILTAHELDQVMTVLTYSGAAYHYAPIFSQWVDSNLQPVDVDTILHIVADSNQPMARYIAQLEQSKGGTL